jgi:hypothetical protein
MLTKKYWQHFRKVLIEKFIEVLNKKNVETFLI